MRTAPPPRPTNVNARTQATPNRTCASSCATLVLIALLLPRLAFAETYSGQNYSPMGVAGVTTFWTGVASLCVATGFGIDLIAHPQSRGWDEPALTGGLIVAGVVLVAVAIYLLAADALGGMIKGMI